MRYIDILELNLIAILFNYKWYWPFHHLRQFFTMDKLAQDVKALTLRVAVLESARKGALKVNLHKDYVIAST